MTRVAVLGATGFVGGAVSMALQRHGHEVVSVSAPRLEPCTAEVARQVIHDCVIHRLRAAFVDTAVVINCAGMADAGDAAEAQLMAANAALVTHVAQAAGGRRFIHVSSAAVQGSLPVLDATQSYSTFSPYSRSKQVGEQCALMRGDEVVVYRPPGVHGPNRSLTRAIARLARSPLSSVAAPGSQHSPQVLIDNVADALAFLAEVPTSPPRIVSHPWEGLTVAGLLELLGGRQPKRVPHVVARAAVKAAIQLGRRSARMAANGRRLELLWLGQEQADSWLTATGWQAPVGQDGWRALGTQLRNDDMHGERGNG